MATTQRNLYGSGSNLDNASNNIQDTLLGDDKVKITITSGPVVTILKGSMFDYNGKRQIIEDNILVTIDTLSDNYIEFDGADFITSNSIGIWDTEKQGFYNSGSRVLKAYVDIPNLSVLDLVDLKTVYVPTTKRFDRCRVVLTANQSQGGAGVLQFNDVLIDTLSSFDNINYRFVAPETGLYLITCSLYTIGPSGATALDCSIRKNGATDISDLRGRTSRTVVTTGYILRSSDTLEWLEKDEYVDVYNNTGLIGSNFQAVNSSTYLEVLKLL